VLVSVNGELRPRAEAVVSVFDAGFVLGDGVWEGLRVRRGHPVFLDQHLDRLWQGAAAIALDIGLSRKQLADRLYETLAANAMTGGRDGGDDGDGVHIRLMVTRGLKSSPYQDPRLSGGPPTIVIAAEYKELAPGAAAKGLELFTVHVRRAPPDTLDPRLNSHSKLNDVLACIQAYTAGADEALMLDPHGFVAACNSTHFFAVSGDEVWTSTGDYCLAGITRSTVLRLCEEAAIKVREKRFSVVDVYGADEAFVTGTLGGIIPVRTVDGRVIGSGQRGAMVERLQELYEHSVLEDVEERAKAR
jgi:branched-chain amino acid aminotransferase